MEAFLELLLQFDLPIRARNKRVCLSCRDALFKRVLVVAASQSNWLFATKPISYILFSFSHFFPSWKKMRAATLF
jgi:hypothetical protein